MLYSVKMRSSLGGYHGEGGRHISGAERIVPEDQVEADVIAMLRRAGLGVAMCNGSKGAKAAADVITMQDNNHDGLVPYLEQFFHI